MLKNLLFRHRKPLDEEQNDAQDMASKHFWISIDECRSCGKCKKACNVEAIIEEKGGMYVIDQQKCIKCGSCLRYCRHRAIKC